MWKKFFEFIGIMVYITLAVSIIFGLAVFKEINKYRLVITPGNPSSVTIELLR